MRALLPIIAVAGHLVALQLVTGILVWVASPWPWLSTPLAIAWLALLVADLRHPRLAGALARWPRALALLLAQAPAVVFGLWNVLYFLGVAPRFELGAFVIHLWLTPLTPLLAWCPAGEALGRDLWLWALSLAPLTLVAAAFLAADCRGRITAR